MNWSGYFNGSIIAIFFMATVGDPALAEPASRPASRPAASSTPASLPASQPAGFDHAALGILLRRYVSDERVDYRAWKASTENQAALAGYLERLAAADPTGWSRNEKLALFINAYNAITIKSILEAYPVRSIKNIPGVWTTRKWTVAGRELTLDQIENVALRGEFQEPRIHFAIVCASKGCPPIQPWAYSAGRVSEQLDSVTRAFLNSPARTRVDLERRRLFLSSIFKWFAEDFVRAPAFVARYRSTQEAEALGQGGWTIAYDNYDWSLNGVE